MQVDPGQIESGRRIVNRALELRLIDWRPWGHSKVSRVENGKSRTVCHVSHVDTQELNNKLKEKNIITNAKGKRSQMGFILHCQNARE